MPKTRKKSKTVQTGHLYRTLEIDRQSINVEARTAELSFSSETPIKRWFGTEILDHDAGSVRLERINTGGPLLLGHDRWDPDNHVGVVENAQIDTAARKGRATVRFSQSARASEIFQDVIDEIRTSVSVGYIIHEMLEDRDEREFRAIDWEPLEFSLVPVPADTSVGVGRSAVREGDEYAEHETNIRSLEVKTDMKLQRLEGETDEQLAVRQAAEDARVAALENPSAEPTVQVTNTPAPVTVDVNAERTASAVSERERGQAIRARCKQFGREDLVDEFINSGRSLEELDRKILEGLPSQEIQPDSAEIGLTDRERGEFSFLKLIRAQCAQKGVDGFGPRMIEAARFELDCAIAADDLHGMDANGLRIPFDVLRGTTEQRQRGSDMREVIGLLRALVGEGASQRDLQVAIGSAGGNLVAEQFLGASFIDLLRNNEVTAALGVQSLDGLVGDIAIPKQTGAATAYWIGEGGAPTESQQVIGQIGMTPKTLAAYTDYSRKLALQSAIGVEEFIRMDFARIIALENDRACLYGTGAAGEPKGIVNWADLNTTAFSTTSAPTWSEVVDMEGDVATDNALMGTLAYATHPTVRANMKTTSKAGTEAIFVMGEDGMLNGYRCPVSTQILATDVLFGNWADCVMGSWGGIDVLVDPYTHSTTGTIRIVIFTSCDVMVRHGQSFSRGQ